MLGSLRILAGRTTIRNLPPKQFASKNSVVLSQRQHRGISLLSKACNSINHSASTERFPPFSMRSTFRQCSSTSSPPGTSGPIFNVQDVKDFHDRVIKSSIPVVVDFQATWCDPCKILEPRLEKVIAKQEGKVHLAKVDIDKLEDLAFQYKVRAVPTVVSFKNGVRVDDFMGVQEEDILTSFVESLLVK